MIGDLLRRNYKTFVSYREYIDEYESHWQRKKKGKGCETLKYKSLSEGKVPWKRTIIDTLNSKK